MAGNNAREERGSLNFHVAYLLYFRYAQRAGMHSWECIFYRSEIGGSVLFERT